MGKIGSIIGSTLGGALGTLVAPGFGTTIGASLGGALGGSVGKNGGSGDTGGGGGGSTTGTGGASSPGAGIAGGALGALQLIQGMAQQRKANKLRPGLEDPEQRMFLNEINQRRKAMRSGSAYTEDLRLLGGQQASTNQGLVSAGGGAGGATINALLKSQRGTGAAYGGILANAEKTASAYDSMYEGVLEKVASRKLDLQTFEYNRALANAAKNKQAGESNILAALARQGPITMPGAQNNTQEVPDENAPDEGIIQYGDSG